jgi:predicted outer membrane lipoprotein
VPPSNQSSSQKGAPPTKGSPAEPDYRRWILGFLTVAFALAAIWLNFVDDYGNQMVAASSVRITVVLAILWLALPDVMRGPAVFFYMLVAVVAVAAMVKGGKNSLKILVPAMFVIGVLSFLRRFTGGGSPRRGA